VTLGARKAALLFAALALALPANLFLEIHDMLPLRDSHFALQT